MDGFIYLDCNAMGQGIVGNLSHLAGWTLKTFFNANYYVTVVYLFKLLKV